MIKNYILQTIGERKVDIGIVMVYNYCPPTKPSRLVSPTPQEYLIEEKGRAILVKLVDDSADVKICGRDNKEIEKTAKSFGKKLSKYNLELITA